MRHRDFHRACLEFDWGWRASVDPQVCAAGAQREHERRRSAEARSLHVGEARRGRRVPTPRAAIDGG